MNFVGFVLLFTVYQGGVPTQNTPTFYYTHEQCEAALITARSHYSSKGYRFTGDCLDTRLPQVREHLEWEARQNIKRL